MRPIYNSIDSFPQDGPGQNTNEYIMHYKGPCNQSQTTSVFTLWTSTGAHDVEISFRLPSPSPALIIMCFNADNVTSQAYLKTNPFKVHTIRSSESLFVIPANIVLSLHYSFKSNKKFS